MRALIYMLAFFLFNNCFSQQQFIMGQKQNMVFTDYAPDMDYNCQWPSGMHSCWTPFNFDVNHDGTDDFLLSISYYECMYTSVRIWRLTALGNVEFVADSLGITPFHTGDTVRPGTNFSPDFTLTYASTDSNFNTTYDTTAFIRSTWWLDTASDGNTLICYSGGGIGCPTGLFNWQIDRPDTAYIAFRLIENGDTAYGWVKTYFNDVFDIRGESFAVSGGTGSYIYSGIEPVANESEVKIYPNPASSTLLIQSPFSDFQAEVVSLDGRKQLSTKVNSGTGSSIDISTLAGGLYFVSFNAGDRVVTKRFIKE